MICTEIPCHAQRDDECSESQDEHMPRSPQVESTDAGHKSICHRQVEHPPQDVHRRRRQAYPGGRCKRGLERHARHAVPQVGYRVREEGPTEEVRYVVIPECRHFLQ